MLNEEKIRLMADLAVFEKKNGGRMQAVTSYFKSDYISRNMIRGFISYTLCCVMILAIWVLFNMDVFLSTIGIDALTGLAWKGGAVYLVGLVLYMALICVIYGKRYDYQARKNRIYIAKLKHLDKRYDYHSRSRELAREGRSV